MERNIHCLSLISVLVAAPNTRRRMEIAQREAGKWALKQSAFNVANEFIEGELGWASFESREAKSKILYFTIIRQMPCDRWPRVILNAIETTSHFSKVYKRMLELSELYEWHASDARTASNDEFNWDSFRRDVKEHIITELQMPPQFLKN